MVGLVRRKMHFEQVQPLVDLIVALQRQLDAAKRRIEELERKLGGSPTAKVDHGQRVSISLKRKDFGEEGGVEHAADHFAAQAVLDGMTLE